MFGSNNTHDGMIDMNSQILQSDIALLDDSQDIEKELVIFSATRNNNLVLFYQ